MAKRDYLPEVCSRAKSAIKTLTWSLRERGTCAGPRPVVAADVRSPVGPERRSVPVLPVATFERASWNT
jgi:hypothetical protein